MSYSKTYSIGIENLFLCRNQRIVKPFKDGYNKMPYRAFIVVINLSLIT